MSRAGNWPDGLRWIVRRVKLSRRQMRNLAAYEKKTGWRYSIICTNIPLAGIEDVPGSHHPLYIDVTHREHACVETAGVRTAKAMGLRSLPSKTWQVNCGWVIAANIAADLAAWTRLLGQCDDGELRDADPDTLRPDLAHPRPARPPRPPADPGHQPRLALEGRVPRLLATALRPFPHQPDQQQPSQRHERRPAPARSEPVRTRAHRALPHHQPARQTDTTPETGHQHNQ